MSRCGTITRVLIHSNTIYVKRAIASLDSDLLYMAKEGLGTGKLWYISNAIFYFIHGIRRTHGSSSSMLTHESAAECH